MNNQGKAVYNCQVKTISRPTFYHIHANQRSLWQDIVHKV